jgi:hypothetical protein
MALKKKQYTEEYAGLDAEYYFNREAPIVTIITNRDVGKTTNVFGYLSTLNKGFIILVRYKYEMEDYQSKFIKACEYYGTNIIFDKKKDAFVDSNGKVIGFICALSGANSAKNKAEKYAGVEYIIFDEFLPADQHYLKETSHPGFEFKMLGWIIGSARKGGNGIINKNVKVILMANLVDAMNPYFKSIQDSNGTSLLTHLAGAIHTGQTNFTYEDNEVYLTVHIDKSYKSNDSLTKLVDGYNENGLANDFLKQFSYRVMAKNPAIIKQMKKPILSIGMVDMYVIKVKTKLDFGNTTIQSDMPVFYWVSNKNGKSTPLQELLQFDFTERFSYYENIVVKSQVQDFMTKYRIQTRYDF